MAPFFRTRCISLCYVRSTAEGQNSIPREGCESHGAYVGKGGGYFMAAGASCRLIYILLLTGPDEALPR